MSESAALVLVTTSFPIRGDGSEAAGSFVSDLAEEVGKHMPVRVVAPGFASGHELWCPGVEVYRYTAPRKPLSTLKPWLPGDLLALGAVMREGRAMTRTAVAAGPAAHVLALWALPSGHWARAVSLDAGVPYSVWTLGSDIWSLGRVPFVRSWLRRVLKEAHSCFSDGLQLAEDTRQIAGREVSFLASTRRIARRRNGSVKSSAPYRLLFLGRWHRNKGVDLLIDALGMLSDDDWQHISSVQICGGGPLEPLVRRGVATLNASGRPVALRGFLDKEAAEEAILDADYVVIPSRIESIPVVFSDAIKLGYPVIASPVGDLPRLIGDAPQCGLLAEAVDAPALAAMVSRALHQPANAFAIGVANMARQFDLAVLAKGIACRLGANRRE